MIVRLPLVKANLITAENLKHLLNELTWNLNLLTDDKAEKRNKELGEMLAIITNNYQELSNINKDIREEIDSKYQPITHKPLIVRNKHEALK